MVQLNRISPKLKLALIASVSFLSACSSLPTTYPPTTEDRSTSSEVQPIITVPDTVVEHSTEVKAENTAVIRKPAAVSAPVKQNPAVIALLDTAKSQRSAGDYSSAQTSLQRAQRISPLDPEVYYDLALTHRDLNDYVLAEQVALKGVSISQGQTEKLRKFWLLIAEVRSSAGNQTGAKQAITKARRY